MAHITLDKLWKGILFDFPNEFLVYFFTKYQHLFDFRKPVEFLDKELEELFPESVDNEKYVDKLLKVYLKDGEEHWILVHVEIQGYRDSSFEERMFIYYYRIYERFKMPITALAVFTDNEPKYYPKSFSKDFMGTRLSYEFNTFKLLEHTEEELMQPGNPFSFVMQVARGAVGKLKSDNDLLDWKVILFKKLLKAGMDKVQIRALTNFLRQYVSFEIKR